MELMIFDNSINITFLITQPQFVIKLSKTKEKQR